MLKTVAQRRIVDGIAARALRANLPLLTNSTSTQVTILFRVTKVEEGEVIGVHTGFVLSLLAGAGSLLRDAGITTQLALFSVQAMIYPLTVGTIARFS
jgi:hypothetical protein